MTGQEPTGFIWDARAPLQARIRMELENGEEEIAFGTEEIIFTTPKDIYGFFSTFDSKHPYVAIHIPLDKNAYRDPGKFTGDIEEVAKEYLIEQTPSLINKSDTLYLVGFQDELLLLASNSTNDGYLIDKYGDISTFDMPESSRPDTYLEDIPDTED